MVAKNILRISLLILAFYFNSIFAATYYVDAVNGNDSNNGTSSSTAWKSISKVNSKVYTPGDNILFKRGQKWTGMLVPSTSGTSSARITYGAYGIGVKPIITIMQIIPNSNKTTSWSVYSGNIWKLAFSFGSVQLDRLWLSNKEYIHSASASEVNSTARWYEDGSYLYVYATSNPATYYSSIIFSGGLNSENYTIKVKDKDYITLENLDVQGGYNGSIGFSGADYLIIQDCKVGYGSFGRGIMGGSLPSIGSSDMTSDYGIIRRDTIYSGWDLYTTYDRSIMDGISLQNGANYWEVYDSYFKNWGHSAIQIYGINSNTNFNKVYRNVFTCPNLSYGRAFETVGTDTNKCKYNEFFRNRVTYMKTRSQIGGVRNKVYYNIFDHLVNATVAHGGGTTAQAIVFAAVSGPSKNNMAYNNTIYSLEREGIWDYGGSNITINNLVMDCGKTCSGLEMRATNDGIAGGKWKNNIVFTPGYTTSNVIISWDQKGQTMSQFNAMNGTNGNVITGNIQYTGNLSGLVKNAAAGDYSPSAGSPVINKGINVGLTEDFYGHPIVGNPDIGAVESGSTSTTPDQTAPAITSTAVTSVLLGQQYTYDVNASGNPAPAFALKVYPSGMTINSSTGLICWTPTATGNYNVTVEANNGVTPAAQQSFTIAVISNTSGTQSPLPNGIISYWKLDETTQGSYADLIGKNTASSSASPTPVTGAVSGAQLFNGTSAKIDVKPNSSIDFGAAGSFSVEFWYKGTTLPSTVKSAVGRYINETGAKWWVGLNAADGKARFYMSAGSNSAAINGNCIVDGNWHHVAATRNGSTGSLKLYVDGVLKGSTNQTFTTAFSSTTSNLNIGWLNFQSAYSLTGSLDEVAFYNTEISSSDIQKHYSNGLSGLSYGGNNLTKIESAQPNGNIDNKSNVAAKPNQFELNQNYPNPFNPTTKIRYSVSQPTNVSIKVYDMLGKEVMTLVNSSHTPGYYEVSFDGSKLASGTYIYQLRTNQYVETKKMMLVK